MSGFDYSLLTGILQLYILYFSNRFHVSVLKLTNDAYIAKPIISFASFSFFFMKFFFDNFLKKKKQRKVVSPCLFFSCLCERQNVCLQFLTLGHFMQTSSKCIKTFLPLYKSFCIVKYLPVVEYIPPNRQLNHQLCIVADTKIYRCVCDSTCSKQAIFWFLFIYFFNTRLLSIVSLNSVVLHTLFSWLFL